MEILKQSWTKVAVGYRQNFVQRFSPWIRDSVISLVNAQPPKQGTVFVAGCGTGEEIVSVSKSLPENNVEAFDLADGMVSLATDLIKENDLESRVKLFVGDATSVPTRLIPLSAAFSCFALQQMPRPAEVLADWTRALAPDGVLCVCYWPKEVESEGPWRRMVEIDPPKSQDEDWEKGIPALAVAQGAEVLSDRRVSHTIEWSSVEAFWDGAYLFSLCCTFHGDDFHLLLSHDSCWAMECASFASWRGANGSAQVLAFIQSPACPFHMSTHFNICCDTVTNKPNLSVMLSRYWY
jgi:SAM-dependent methyltransferase